MDLRSYLKTHTLLDPKFIDDLLDHCGEDIFLNEPKIPVETLAKWLNSEKESLKQRIRKKYKVDIHYKEETSIVKNETGGWKHVEFLITPDVFKEMCLKSQTSRGDEVRRYFMDMEKAFVRYKDYVIEGMKREREALLRNQRPHPHYPKRDTIYIFTAPDEFAEFRDRRLIRIGRTKDLNHRMLSHNSPMADDIEILAQIPVNDAVRVESCMKMFLKDVQYRRRKEVYDITEANVKKILEHCEGASVEIASFVKKVDEAKRGGRRIYAVKSASR